MRRLSYIIVAIAIVLAGIGFWKIKQRSPIADAPEFNYAHNNTTPPPATDIVNKENKPPTPVPTTNPKPVNLPVPFTPQAPTANWDELHNEACEEASSIMVSEYFKGTKTTTLEPDFVERQIATLTAWQDEHFGYHLDTNAQETAQMIEAVYNLKTKLITNFTEEQFKDELNQNHLIILPADGRLLGNPNYKQPGPVYHMLVLRGYTATNFIVNDPGTRRGQNYPYAFSALNHAAGDWNHDLNKTDTAQKIAIVVWK